VPMVTSRVLSTWVSAGTLPRPYLPSPLPTLALTYPRPYLPSPLPTLALTYLPPSPTLTLPLGTSRKMAPTFTKAEAAADTGGGGGGGGVSGGGVGGAGGGAGGGGGGRAEAYELFLRYEAWKAAYNAYDVMDAVRHILSIPWRYLLWLYVPWLYVPWLHLLWLYLPIGAAHFLPAEVGRLPGTAHR
jgi:hypothetical protein